MVKLRTAYPCNLKLLLIFLVVFGHAIEPRIGTSPELYRLYRAIYLFHMPLFTFLSGLFMKTPDGCIRQLKRILRIYLCCQAVAVVMGLTPWHTPWWIEWYLLSLCCWLGIAAVLMKCRHRWAILAAAFALGCLCGWIPMLGRWMSLSRTVVFFPWFFLGTLVPPDFPWHRLRLPSLAALPVLGADIPVTVLYQAGACDPALRLLCYLCAAALSLLALSWCPRRRFPWTRAGTDTMPAYLLHGPLLRLLTPVRHPLLFTLFFLCIITQATRWRNASGIIGKEECPWPDLKTCTKPRESRSTGFSWP